MKKIMFNEEYGLQTAVLDGRKTMTRRMVLPKISVSAKLGEIKGFDRAEDYILRHSYFNEDDVVAIAQSYEEIYYSIPEQSRDKISSKAGWRNKMFVKAELMPHHIRITNVKVEHLQDITEEDCLREGIQEYFPYINRDPNDRLRTFQYFKNGKIRYRRSPATECFANFIDDISGKGTWESNPLVYAYEFELID